MPFCAVACYWVWQASLCPCSRTVAKITATAMKRPRSRHCPRQQRHTLGIGVARCGTAWCTPRGQTDPVCQPFPLTNTPIPNAKVELESKGQKLLLQTDANGIGASRCRMVATSGQSRIAGNRASQRRQRFAGRQTWRLAMATAQATRLADGSVFMPQASQQMLGLRTTTSKPQAVAQRVTLNGVVVTDPNASAVIQPTLSWTFACPGQAVSPALAARSKKGKPSPSLNPPPAIPTKATSRTKSLNYAPNWHWQRKMPHG